MAWHGLGVDLSLEDTWMASSGKAPEAEPLSLSPPLNPPSLDFVIAHLQLTLALHCLPRPPFGPPCTHHAFPPGTRAHAAPLAGGSSKKASPRQIPAIPQQITPFGPFEAGRLGLWALDSCSPRLLGRHSFDRIGVEVWMCLVP